jgi:hypothetical protein
MQDSKINIFTNLYSFFINNNKNKSIFIFKNYKYKLKYLTLTILATLLLIFPLACGGLGDGSDNPAEIELPDNPIERAAINGLITSYRESTMWQIQNVEPINITPMAPSGELLELQDPKEVYCVCLQYDARYKITWSTNEGSPWEKTIRNILVIKTQGDQFLAVKPMNICSPFCG